ncbi:MAG: hypothetical protein Q8934_14285 [Bacillota bacterium]|nr:hypothetical protein [Bacillota bacterium]
MLKHKVKSLQKEIKRINNISENKVYIVDDEDEGFNIFEAGKEILKCNREELGVFEKRRPGSVFIINDIPCA